MVCFSSVLAQAPPEPSWYGSSYLSIPQDKSLILEGAIAPSYEVLEWKRSSWAIKAVITPEVLLQMSNGKSTPIHSPSYKPRISLLSAWTDGRFTLFPYVTLAHHSNGQDGPFRGDSGRVNTESGSFSTNFVQAGYFFTLDALPGHMIGVSFEFHPTRGIFSIDESIQNLYGRKRVSYQYQYVRPSVRYEAIYVRIMDNAEGTPGSTYSMKVKWRVPGFRKMVWLFANYYEGQNYYNVLFQERLRQFKAGLSIDAKFVGNKLIEIDG